MTPHQLRLIPWLEKLTIQTKDLVTERIRFDGDYAWAQVPFVQLFERQYNSGKPVRLIVLKARQLGISTISQGILFNWCFLHPGTNALVLANETVTARSIYNKTKMFWNTWPFRPLYHTQTLTRQETMWSETGSSIQIATARNMNAGVGRTIHALHASECALWENAETLMAGLNQTIPNRHGTFVILESTARGIGNWFYDQWEAAINHESEYIPVFFPWFKHPEYRVDVPILKVTDLTVEERDYYKLGCDLAHLEWRRWAVPNQCNNDYDYFKREYPAFPEEAFQRTGTNVFAIDRLGDCYEPIDGARGRIELHGQRARYIEDRNGPLRLFHWPGRDAQYVIGGDPSYTTEGDQACIQVLNRRTFEQVAVWHGKIDAVHFADELVALAMYFNKALINVEIEGPGYGTISSLVRIGYPNIWQHRWADRAQGKVSNSLGWSTTFNRKHWAIGDLKWAVADASITIHDQVTFNQMRNYVVKPNGEMGNNSNVGYDDAVMALAIALITAVTEGPPERMADEPKSLIPRDMRDEFIGV